MKNKLYLFISILIIIIIFGTAVICNQCSITPSAGTTLTSSEDGIETETASNTTQSKKTTEKETTAKTTTTAKETTATEAGTATKSSESIQITETVQTLVTLTFEPKQGFAGVEVVTLSLSEPVGDSPKVYYNGKLLKSTVSADKKTLTVTIPYDSASGYFKVEYDGKSVQSAEQFVVVGNSTVQSIADLVITGMGPESATGPGRIYVSIKNVGTLDLVNADIHVTCYAAGFLRTDSNSTLPAASDEWLKCSLSAGGTGFFYPSMIINVALYSYQVVMCTIDLSGDPTPNTLTIQIP